jgi:hydrogen peroxide-dependent heme synthase
MTLPLIKLDRGIHVMHLFYSIDRRRWSDLAAGEAAQALQRVEALAAKNNQPSHPKLRSYAVVGAKADFACILYGAELGVVAQMHRDLESCFPAGTLVREYSYFSVTELTEYMPSDEDNRATLAAEKLEPDSEAYEKRWAEMSKRKADYEQFRLYPELPDWEVMGFYPMSKRRQGSDNWYSQDLAARKKLMGGHARVGRKYTGRISQLISGSTGLDDWEWGVTLMAHQVDALKDIVYEMRFDEVSARYGEFGRFFISMKMAPNDLWQHLHL